MELSEEIKLFVFQDIDVDIYSHRTVSAEVAWKIINEGFRFTESFQKTTDEIIDDIIYMRYWDSLRKHYGNFIVVIVFSKALIKEINAKLGPDYEVHQALSRIELEHPDDKVGDATFILPKQFLKGFINRETGEITANPDFNPAFKPIGLAAQIEFLNGH